MALENCPSYYDSIQFTLKLSGLRQWQYLFCSRICCLGWGSLVFVLFDFRWAGLKPGDWNHLKASSFTCLAIDVVSWNILKLSAETSPYALFLWSELPPNMVTGFWGWALQKRVSQVEAVSSYPLYDLAPEVTEYCFCPIGYNSHSCQPDSRGGSMDPIFQWEDVGSIVSTGG